MGLPRVFVSFATTNISRQETELGQQLINDLCSMDAEVVTDDESVPDAQFMQFLQQELAHCQWLILIQTAEAARSLRVQVTMNTAQQQVARGTMRGMLRIVCSSSEEVDDTERYTEATAFSYSGDYPRIRDKVLLALDLLHVDDVIEKNLYKASTISLPAEADSPAPRQKQASSRKDVPTVSIAGDKKKLGEFPPIQPIQPIVQGDRPVVRPRLVNKKRLFLLCSLIVLFIILLIAGTGVAKGLFVSRITPTVQRTLVLKVPTVAPTATRTIGTAVVSSPTTMNGATIFAQDNFQRTNQTLWGTASDGQLWEGDANHSNAFSIQNNSGQIVTTTNGATFSSLLGPVSTNVEATVTGSVNHFFATADQANLGLVLRWQDQNNWYKALIDGTNFSIIKHLNGVASTPSSVPFAARDGVSYTVLFRAIGSQLNAKVWPAGTTEPTGWMLSLNDPSFATGKSGIRTVMQPNMQINITMFKAIAV
jgi:hypothetical protein